MPHKCPRTIWRPAKYVHVCIPGHECCSHFVRSVRNAGKDTRSPVPGNVVLSLSGRPLGCSLEIAKASGPADVSRLGLRISAGADILAKNLDDKFCQNVQTDTLAASKRCCRTSDVWPRRPRARDRGRMEASLQSSSVGYGRKRRKKGGL